MIDGLLSWNERGTLVRRVVPLTSPTAMVSLGEGRTSIFSCNVVVLTQCLEDFGCLG